MPSPQQLHDDHDDEGHDNDESGPPGSWWKPTAAYLPWQWEIDHPLNTSSASDMGTGITAWNGDTAPGDNPVVYDIDGILNPASTVATLHADGFHAVCYIEVGTAGNYYTSADEGIPTTYYAQLSAAGDLGDKLAAIRSTSSTSTRRPPSASSKP